jgi:NitT/TauT family transport system substrate-binding protein
LTKQFAQLIRQASVRGLGLCALFLFTNFCGAAEIRLGFFPNITHAQALIGVANGTFQQELGSNVKLETKTFNAGPAEIDALFAGEIDAGFIGPSPAVNGYVKSKGDALRVIAGGASGGASLVVSAASNIKTAKDLAGKTIASPQLGNTQDVALRSYIAAAGLKTKENGGNVTVQPIANADALTQFKQGKLDGAWVPEPWATLIVQAGGTRLIDERTLWPNNQFVTTNLIVSRTFLEKYPDVVEALLRGEIKVTQYIQANPADAKSS